MQEAEGWVRVEPVTDFHVDKVPALIEIARRHMRDSDFYWVQRDDIGCKGTTGRSFSSATTRYWSGFGLTATQRRRCFEPREGDSRYLAVVSCYRTDPTAGAA